MRRGFWSTLRRVGRSTTGNSLELSLDGDSSFRAIWKAIRSARRRVWVEMYIVEDDPIGRHTITLLTRAARRGCEVLLSYDALGSYSLPEAVLEELRAAGGRAAAYNPPLLPTGSPPFVRDHRKLVITDDRAFLGGLNLGVEYAGPRLGKNEFRDVLIALEGPAVESLAAMFRLSAGRLAPKARGSSSPSTSGGSHEVIVLASDQRRDIRTLQRALGVALKRAEYSALLVSPYFLPTPALGRGMISAARRGVEVRILTAGQSDSRLAQAAGRHAYPRFQAAGIQVAELQGGTLHAKAAVIDDEVVFLGSFNLDRWSGYRNLELAVATRSRELARDLQQEFGTAAKDARTVTSDRTTYGLPRRIGHWLAYQLLRL